MKRIVIIIFIIIFLSGCNNRVNYIDDNIKYVLENITINKLDEYNDEIKDYIVYVSRPACSDCNLLDDRIINDVKSNIFLNELKYLDVSELYKSKTKWNLFKKENHIEGTPSFIHYKNGKVVSTYGWTEKDGFNYEIFLKWLNEECDKNG